jgi:TRAP-type C4-dicarboxylate transport system permease large subunit
MSHLGAVLRPGALPLDEPEVAGASHLRLDRDRLVGCFIDIIAAITILVPILLPIVLKLGIDPIHFGLIMVLNLMTGLLYPPLGMVLFVLARTWKLPVERTTITILP